MRGQCAMVAFSAPEYQPDASIRIVPYAFAGSVGDGWLISREGREHLRLGPGYQRMRVSHCGVCATDLARRHLPFPLPQITGHEVVAIDDAGRPAVVEINASCVGRGLDRGDWCNFCAAGLATHCRARLVLGIHDLPGGFSPWLLAPVGNVHALPPAITPATATLVEPFAAALQALRALDLERCGRVAVLGTGRLGLLVVAALAAHRARVNGGYEILALARQADKRALALALGADEAIDATDAGSMRDLAEVVIDTTGSPHGLEVALRLATREVHLKSTTGQPALGLAHLTELVVDELTLAPLDDTRVAPVARRRLPSPPPRVAALLGSAVPGRVARDLHARGLQTIADADPATLAEVLARDQGMRHHGADLAVVASLAGIDAAIRPRGRRAAGLVRARGTIYVVDVGQPREGLLAALLDKGLVVSTSRCGEFPPAIELLAQRAPGLGAALGERMITHALPATRLAEAFAVAARPGTVKVAVTHEGCVL